jgi:hypothetical protein
MDDFCPATELAQLREDYVAIQRLLARDPEVLDRKAPHVSGWSAAQHLAHLALANELVVRNLRSLLKGEGPLVVEEGVTPPDALAVLQSGRFPRGAAQAPRMVRPPEEVRRDYLGEWIAQGLEEFAELAARSDAILAAPRFIPHQVLGPLTAARWVRFASMHTRHHLDIAREVLATFGAGAGAASAE